MTELLNSYQAAAHAARLCRVQAVVGHGSVLKEAEMIASREAAMNPAKPPEWRPEFGDYIDSGAVYAAIGRSLQGKRTLLADAVWLKPGAHHRLPIVATSQEPRNWAMNWLPASSQEALDMIIASYAIAEDRSVLMPSCVVLDKLSTMTYEPVELPGQKIIDNLLKPLKLESPEKHLQYAGHSLEHAGRLQKAMEAAPKSVARFSEAWKKRFKSSFPLVEPFMLEDAEYAIVVYGSASNSAKLAVRRLRQRGEKAGLLRLRCLRPWPESELQAALGKISKIGIVDDQNSLSLGSWSKLYQGIKTWYHGLAQNFIAPSAGATVKDFLEILDRTKKAEKAERIWLI
jgi:hypothetical protein